MQTIATVNDVDLEVTFEIPPYVPAKIFAPVERCHPEEGGVVEFESVCLDGIDILPLLADSVIEQITEQCYAAAEKQAEKDAEDFYAMIRDEEHEWRDAA